MRAKILSPLFPACLDTVVGGVIRAVAADVSPWPICNGRPAATD